MQSGDAPSKGGLVLDLLSTSSVQSARQRGRTFTISFGTTDLRDVSDGHLPVEVWRVNRMPDRLDETYHATVGDGRKLKTTCRRAGAGSVARAVEQYIELRTPANRSMGVEQPTLPGVGDAPAAFDECCGQLQLVLREDERKTRTIRSEPITSGTGQYLGARLVWHFVVAGCPRLMYLAYCPFCGTKLQGVLHNDRPTPSAGDRELEERCPIR